MKHSYLKKVLIIFILSLSSGLFFSCKKTELSETEFVVQRELNDFIYQYTYDALDPYSYRKTYLPPSLRRLLETPVIDDGIVKYVYELLFTNETRSIYIDSLDNNMYDCHSDDASWVDLLFTTMEEERIGQEIEKMENIINSDELHVDESEESLIAEELIDEIATKAFIDYKHNLASAEYDKEIFIPEKNGDNWILIHAYEKDVKRFFYDSIFRCYKQENWEIKQGETEKIIKTIETSFKDNTYIPITKNFKEDTSRKYQEYDTDGYLVLEENYSIYEDKEYVNDTLSLKYNGEHKVIESSVMEYHYTDDKFSELEYSFNKKYIYKYNKDDIPPNFDYYEDNILRMSNKYKTKSDYTSEIYFADGFSVTSLYENDKLKKEIFTINGIEERIKNYE